jgi:hypothetical protein
MAALTIMAEVAEGDFQTDIRPTPQNQFPALFDNHALYSPAGAFRFIFQLTDGNAVIQVLDDTGYASGNNIDNPQGPTVLGSHLPWVPIWSTGTQGASSIQMQWDGNLVVNTPKGPIGISNTAGNQGAYLRMQDDGNLVVYSATNQALWSSNTNAKA